MSGTPASHRHYTVGTANKTYVQKLSIFYLKSILYNVTQVQGSLNQDVRPCKFSAKVWAKNAHGIQHLVKCLVRMPELPIRIILCHDHFNTSVFLLIYNLRDKQNL